MLVMMCMRAAVLEYLLDPGGHQCHKTHATAQVPKYLPRAKYQQLSLQNQVTGGWGVQVGVSQREFSVK